MSTFTYVCMAWVQNAFSIFPWTHWRLVGQSAKHSVVHKSGSPIKSRLDHDFGSSKSLTRKKLYTHGKIAIFLVFNLASIIPAPAISWILDVSVLKIVTEL